MLLERSNPAKLALTGKCLHAFLDVEDREHFAIES